MSPLSSRSEMSQRLIPGARSPKQTLRLKHERFKVQNMFVEGLCRLAGASKA